MVLQQELPCAVESGLEVLASAHRSDGAPRLGEALEVDLGAVAGAAQAHARAQHVAHEMRPLARRAGVAALAGQQRRILHLGPHRVHIVAERREADLVFREQLLAQLYDLGLFRVRARAVESLHAADMPGREVLRFIANELEELLADRRVVPGFLAVVEHVVVLARTPVGRQAEGRGAAIPVVSREDVVGAVAQRAVDIDVVAEAAHRSETHPEHS